MEGNSQKPEIDREYTFFQSILAKLVSEGHKGKYALIHNQELIGIYGSEKEAYEDGVMRFGTSVFLTQLISDEVRPESIQFLLHVHSQ